MAKYEVLETSYINGRIHQPGEQIDYDGEPSGNLKPLDKPAQKAAAAAPAADVAKLVGQTRIRAASRGVSPDQVSRDDLDVVIGEQDPAPSAATLAAAEAVLGFSADQLA